MTLEQAAVDAHAALDTADDYTAAWKTWLDAAAAFQGAVTEHAKDESKPRVDVEMAVKKAVRQPTPTEA
ncbi:hypothetical protein ACWD25_45645 [Streptomyces sp. NPDC002920]